MRRLTQFAYRAQKRFWRLVRPRTRGVKVMLFNRDEQILLIRNSYGESDLFLLPGGGVRPWETPGDAVRREVREELGCGLKALKPVSTHSTSAEGKRDTIFLFEAKLVGSPQANPSEVAEAEFFALDALPIALSPATARRLAERSAMVQADGVW